MPGQIRFADFIANQPTNNSPEYTAGIENSGGVNITIKANNGGSAIVLLSKKTLDMNITTDQTITLSGGTVFVITDMVLTNASTNISTASDFEVWTGTSRSGYEAAVASGNGYPRSLGLTTASAYISSITQNTIAINANAVSSTVGTTLYASLGTPQGVASTADFYVYGYIIA
jgi:hypothetical protein